MDRTRELIPILTRIDPSTLDLSEPVRHPSGATLRTWTKADGLELLENFVLEVGSNSAWRLVTRNHEGADLASGGTSLILAAMAAAIVEEYLALVALRALDVHLKELRIELPAMMSGPVAKPRIYIETVDTLSDTDRRQLAIEAMGASPARGLLGQKLDNSFSLARNNRRIMLPDLPPAIGRPLAGSAGKWQQARQEKINAQHAGYRAGNSTASKLIVANAVSDGQSHVDVNVTGSQSGNLTLRMRINESESGQVSFPNWQSVLSAGVSAEFTERIYQQSQLAGIHLEAAELTLDSHFSPGGASSNTGKPGKTSPFGFHVEIASDAAEMAIKDLVQQTTMESLGQQFTRRANPPVLECRGSRPEPKTIGLLQRIFSRN